MQTFALLILLAATVVLVAPVVVGQGLDAGVKVQCKQVGLNPKVCRERMVMNPGGFSVSSLTYDKKNGLVREKKVDSYGFRDLDDLPSGFWAAVLDDASIGHQAEDCAKSCDGVGHFLVERIQDASSCMCLRRGVPTQVPVQIDEGDGKFYPELVRTICALVILPRIISHYQDDDESDKFGADIVDCTNEARDYQDEVCAADDDDEQDSISADCE